MSSPLFTVADLFAGCGGLSYGFSQTGHFDIVLGLDNDLDSINTFVYNHVRQGHPHPAPVSSHVDIQTLGWLELIGLLTTRTKDVDVIIGGPPCEGYSKNRTNIAKRGKVHEDGAVWTPRNDFLDDPRNQLFRYFIDIAVHVRPKVIMIENVPEILTWNDGESLNEIVRTLNNSGYPSVSHDVLNAAHFGVPQLRRRAFIVATRYDVAPFTFPAPTHGEHPLQPLVTVRAAISDLPAPSSALMFPRHHIATDLVGDKLARALALGPGMTMDDLHRVDPNHPLLTKSWHGGAYSRLLWDQPAWTITKSFFHTGSGRFTHPEEHRALTAREAARLQTFPDDFDFLATKQVSRASMIGSAVPPLLARALAEQIYRTLTATRP